MRYVVLQVITW